MANKKRGSSTMEIVLCIGVITFILFFPIAMFSLTNRQTTMSTLLIHGLQIVSLEGGLTDRAEELIVSNANRLGFNRRRPDGTNELIISSNRDARGGLDANRVSKIDGDALIVLMIQYPVDLEARFLNSIGNLINSEGFMEEAGYFTVSGYVHSEWVRP